MDQRKVNMLAREYCDDIKKTDKPVIISHHMMMGLLEGQAKMSKSDPNSAIFMEDTPDDVRRKIKKAYCPEKVIEENPIIDYARYIILPAFDNVMKVSRKKEDKTFEDIVYTTYEQLEADFVSGRLHPMDLKTAVAEHINKLLDPVRKHFETDPYAKMLLDMIKKW